MEGYQEQWLAALGNKMWKLHGIKTKIFHNQNIVERDQQLYATMSDYFSPHSEYKKI